MLGPPLRRHGFASQTPRRVSLDGSENKTLGITPVNHAMSTGALIGLFYEARITQVRIGKILLGEVAHEGADQARHQRRTR